MSSVLNKTHVAIIGGCGHVGLPLGVKFALAGAKTSLVDLNQKAVERVNSGKFPFLEHGGDAQLQKALDLGLRATTEVSACAEANVVVFVIIASPLDGIAANFIGSCAVSARR